MPKRKLRKFSKGAVRDSDDNKENYIESISWLALRRYAFYMKECEKKYGKGNWKKGIPVDSFEESLLRHIQKYLMKKYDGIDVEPDCDHLSAALFNLQGLIHEEEKLKYEKIS